MEEVLRKDGKKISAAGIKRFLDERQAERTAKLGESTGLGDLLTFMPAAQAGKALKAGSKANAAVNALAFTSQFDDSKGGQAVGDALAYFPVFGFGSTKGLAAQQTRLRRLAEAGKTGDLPFLMGEGKMAPSRFKRFEKGMRQYIEQSSSKDPKTTQALMDQWLESFSRNKPIDKHALFDRMPAELRPALYQTAKEQGYGGIAIGTRSKAPMDKFGNRVTKGENLAELEKAGKYTSGGRMNPTQTAAGDPRKWEEVLQFEQKGGVPSRWEKAFKRQQQEDRAVEYLRSMNAGVAGGAAVGLLSGKNGGSEGGQEAGLVVNRRNLPRLAKLQAERLAQLDKIRPNNQQLNELEATFAAKYPKIYQKATADSGGMFQNEHGFSGTGSFSPHTGKVTLISPEKDAEWFKNPKLSSELFDSMGHEATHAVDFQRLGKVNDITTGRRLDMNDFLSKEMSKYLFLPGVERRLKEKGLSIPTKIDPQYETWGKMKNSHPDTEMVLEAYKRQPIEARAYKAGATSRKSNSKLFEALVDPDSLPADPPPVYYPSAADTKKARDRARFERFMELQDVKPGPKINLTDQKYQDLLFNGPE